jgi:hypothetical protein
VLGPAVVMVWKGNPATIGTTGTPGNTLVV